VTDRQRFVEHARPRDAIFIDLGAIRVIERRGEIGR
jgi:hypothetical protein